MRQPVSAVVKPVNANYHQKTVTDKLHISKRAPEQLNEKATSQGQSKLNDISNNGLAELDAKEFQVDSIQSARSSVDSNRENLKLKDGMSNESSVAGLSEEPGEMEETAENVIEIEESGERVLMQD